MPYDALFRISLQIIFSIVFNRRRPILRTPMNQLELKNSKASAAFSCGPDSQVSKIATIQI